MMPCSWDVVIPSDLCPDWAGYSQPIKDSALWLSSTYLWAATGRRFGSCPITVRPSQSRSEPPAYQEFVVTPGSESLGVLGGPFLFGGRWFNAGCSSMCCGSSACAVVLRGPVTSVDQVLVDGDVVPSSAYRVDVATGAWLLVRTDGACWPVCQNFTRATDQPGTFEISYHLGTAVPEALAIATALLACQYGKHLTGGACALPANMTRISRQGVEIEVEPPEPAEGRTGIQAVDDIVTMLNPSRRTSPPRVMSPDLPEQCDRITVIPVGS
jgi:hypothetical protein